MPPFSLNDPIFSTADLSDITVKTEMMSMALIQLAYTQPKKLENGQMSQKQTVPSGQPILKLKNMDQVLLPTQTLKVSKSGNYLESPDFVGVSQFPVSFLNE